MTRLTITTIPKPDLNRNDLLYIIHSYPWKYFHSTQTHKITTYPSFSWVSMMLGQDILEQIKITNDLWWNNYNIQIHLRKITTVFTHLYREVCNHGNDTTSWPPELSTMLDLWTLSVRRERPWQLAVRVENGATENIKKTSWTEVFKKK